MEICGERYISRLTGIAKERKMQSADIIELDSEKWKESERIIAKGIRQIWVISMKNELVIYIR